MDLSIYTISGSALQIFCAYHLLHSIGEYIALLNFIIVNVPVYNVVVTICDHYLFLLFIFIYNNFIIKIIRRKGATREELNPHIKATPKIYIYIYML